MIKINDIKSYSFSITLILLAAISANQWSKMPVGNTAFEYLVYSLFYLSIGHIIVKNKIKLHSSTYIIVLVFLIWAAIGSIRGFFVAENYWENKALFYNTCIVFMPLLVYVLNEPSLLRQSIRWWLCFGLAAYGLFFYFQVGLTQFYLGPLYFIACFIPFSKNRIAQVVLLALLFALTTYNYQDNRSQLIKGLITFGTIFAIWVSCLIPKFILKLLHLALLIAPMVLLYLGLTGQYNIFEEISEENAGQNTIEVIEEGEIVEYDLMSDTRTIIYEEVLMSAIRNDYIVTGRTLARGNDTFAYSDASEDMMQQRYDDTVKIERSMNELCFPNIFTWLGIIGMVLYAGIYIVASFQAVYFSRNRYIRIFGVVTAAYFAYGWVENATAVDTLNVTYWMFISICMSPYFRKMTNEEFKKWGRSLFRIV